MHGRPCACLLEIGGVDRSLITWHARWSVSSIRWIYLTCPLDKERLGSASKKVLEVEEGLSVPQTPKHQSHLSLMQPAQGLLVVHRATLAERAQPVVSKCTASVSETPPSQDERKHQQLESLITFSLECVTVSRFLLNSVYLSSLAAAVVHNQRRFVFVLLLCFSMAASNQQPLPLTHR